MLATETAETAKSAEIEKTETASLAELAEVNDNSLLFNRQTVHTTFNNGISNFFGEASTSLLKLRGTALESEGMRM
jgi:hypothetical protein